MNHYQKHDTLKMALKEIEVDTGIVTLVLWLNSLSGVTTMYSCEGDNQSVSKEERRNPYVSFTCDDRLSLLNILNKIGHFDGVYCVMDLCPETPTLRYTLKFTERKYLIEFQECL